MDNTNLQSEIAALAERNKPLGYGISDLDGFAAEAHDLFNQAVANETDPAVVDDAAALVHDANRYLRLRAEVRGWRRDW